MKCEFSYDLVSHSVAADGSLFILLGMVSVVHIKYEHDYITNLIEIHNNRHKDNTQSVYVIFLLSRAFPARSNTHASIPLVRDEKQPSFNRSDL